LDSKGDYKQALNFFNKAIQLNPSVANYFYNRGSCFRKLNLVDLAIEDYTHAITVNQGIRDILDDADYYFNRAVAYNCSGRYLKAISDLRRSSSLNPDMKVDIHNQMAIAHQGLWEYKEAFEECRK